ncbi:MAG: hypothetical protein H0T78_02470 [Longispora sp.]|nr:hypothetical protein [Longispora sp. (in: high G+C Gram-positive bacteria)]
MAKVEPTQATPRWVGHLAAILAFAVGAFYVTAELWAAPASRVPATNFEDYSLFQWFMAHAAHAVTHGENPLFTYAMNVPDGVNLMANTAMLAIAMPLVPVTLLFGAHTSIIVAFTASYFLTATAWYWLFTRHLLTHRGSAFVGAAFLGFSPAMIAHGCGQPNLVAQFMIPLLAWATLRLREPGWRAIVRNGVVLGLLAVIQVFINEEILFLTALALLLLVLSYAVMRPREARDHVRPFITGLGVAFLVAAPLLAYPLWFQFFGPRSYHGLPGYLGKYIAPIDSYVTYPRQSILGSAERAAEVSLSPCEEHTLYGWPLVIVLLASIIWLWRNAMVRALAVTAMVFIVLSVGADITLGELTIPGPWQWLEVLPLFNVVTPSRFGLLTTVVAGVVWALGLDRALTVTHKRLATRWIPYVVAAVVLVPLAPRPLPAIDRQVPEFFTSGEWRGYIPPGTSLVSVPLPSRNQEVLRWAARTTIGFDLASGYFLGPTGTNNRTGRFGPLPRPTENLFQQVASGATVEIDQSRKAAALRDLRDWRASVVALDVKHPREQQLRDMVTELLGFPPQQVSGLWLWDVRSIVQ